MRFLAAIAIASLSSNVMAAGLYELPPNTYCLKNICLGQPIASVPEAFNSLSAKGELKAHPCNIQYVAYSNKEHTVTIRLINDPAFSDRDVGNYYRIYEIHVTYPRLASADSDALRDELVKRMGMKEVDRTYKRIVDESRTVKLDRRVNLGMALFGKGSGGEGTETMSLSLVANGNVARLIREAPDCKAAVPSL